MLKGIKWNITEHISEKTLSPSKDKKNGRGARRWEEEEERRKNEMLFVSCNIKYNIILLILDKPIF